jgi:hypothetical protein
VKKPSALTTGAASGLRADWTYYATPSAADYWETAELALEEGVLWRSARNVAGSLIANVGRIEVGQLILLAYGQVTYEAIGIFRVLDPARRVTGTSALSHIDEPALIKRLDTNYMPVGAHTAFLVETVEHLRPGVVVARPTGNNALWRGDRRS